MTRSGTSHWANRATFRTRLPEAVRDDWRGLIARRDATERFDPAAVAALPEPARRWLCHAIAPGTPLKYCVELDQHGEIKLGRWRSFQAKQVLAPREGYIWAVTADLFGLPIHGYDRLTHGTGDMHHRLLGRIPVTSSSGPDHTRSAAARLVSETIWAPAAALPPEVTWEPVGQNEARLVTTFAAHAYAVTITVAPTGALTRITIPRWASLGKAPYREHLFVAECLDEGTFDGYTVPTRVTAGYDDGTGQWPESAFIRQTIDDATYH
jgi:hypothetical protein